MIISQKAALRAAINRKLRIVGDYHQDGEAIYLPEVTVKDLDGDEVVGPISDGQTLKVSTTTSVQSFGRVLLVKVHPAFYTAGNVSVAAVRDPGDRGPVSFRFECTEDGFNPQELPYTVKLFVLEE